MTSEKSPRKGKSRDISHEFCESCREILKNMPEEAWVSVDVPEDILRAEKVLGCRMLKAVIAYVNEKMGKIRFVRR